MNERLFSVRRLWLVVMPHVYSGPGVPGFLFNMISDKNGITFLRSRLVKKKQKKNILLLWTASILNHRLVDVLCILSCKHSVENIKPKNNRYQWLDLTNSIDRILLGATGVFQTERYGLKLYWESLAAEQSDHSIINKRKYCMREKTGNIKCKYFLKNNRKTITALSKKKKSWRQQNINSHNK